jgi:hypothetical protein
MMPLQAERWLAQELHLLRQLTVLQARILSMQAAQALSAKVPEQKQTWLSVLRC